MNIRQVFALWTNVHNMSILFNVTFKKQLAKEEKKMNIKVKYTKSESESESESGRLFLKANEGKTQVL